VNTSPPTIRSIQYVRGIAALMVVWHHARHQVPGLDEWFPIFFSAFGATGVDLFFVVSGFIMAITTRQSEGSPIDFMIRRLVRVVPLYWFLTLLMVAFALAQPALFKTVVIGPDALIKSLFFIPHYSTGIPDSIRPLLVPGWTLNYEMFFYLVLALCLFLPRVHRPVAVPAVMALLVGTNIAFGPFTDAIAISCTNPLLLEFALGFVIGELHATKRIDIPAHLALFFVLAGLVILQTCRELPGAPYLPFAGAGLVIVGVLRVPFGNLPNRGLKLLGDASYSIYLTHIFTLGILRVVWVRLDVLQPSFEAAGLWMSLSLACCSAAGILCYWWIEKPLGVAASRWMRSHRIVASPG
jgi:exopolysaccharide production protein ExoZ